MEGYDRCFQRGQYGWGVSSMNLMQLGVDKFKKKSLEEKFKKGLWGKYIRRRFGYGLWRGVAIDALGTAQKSLEVHTSFASGDIIGGIIGYSVKGIGSIVQISRNAKKEESRERLKGGQRGCNDLLMRYDDFSAHEKRAWEETSMQRKEKGGNRRTY